MQATENATTSSGPPPLRRTPEGDILTSSLADVIQWFLDYDQRVAVIRDRRTEEVFHWKQSQQQQDSTDFQFNTAEDRLAIGIMQAVAEHTEEFQLHVWIANLLNAIEESRQTTEEISESYKLDKVKVESTIERAKSIPTETIRSIYLNSCWLKALCTAEARVLGWIYQSLFGRPFDPSNFPH